MNIKRHVPSQTGKEDEQGQRPTRDLASQNSGFNSGKNLGCKISTFEVPRVDVAKSQGSGDSDL